VADAEYITVAQLSGDCPTFRLSMVGAAPHLAKLASVFNGGPGPTFR
jgi:hypothetical protein